MDAADEERNEEDEVEEGLIQLRDLLIILQHNGEEVDDRILPDEYIGPESYSLHAKDPPLLFNLNGAWYLAACFVALLTVHFEIDTGWLLKRGYLHFACRIISNVAATLTIAVLSTVVYDILGACAEFARRQIFRLIRHFMARQWRKLERTDEHGLRVRPWYFPQVVSDFVSSATLTYLDFVLLVLLVLIKTFGGRFLGWVTVYAESMRWLFSDDFFARTLSTSVISVPGTLEQAGIDFLVWEVLPQILLQTLGAATFYSIGLLFSVKAEEPVIFGEERRDVLSQCIYFLLRAAAAHTMAGTTYQLVTIALAMVETRPEYHMLFNLLPSWSFPIPVRGVLRFLLNQISIAAICYNVMASILLYGFHVLVGLLCRAAIIALWPFWRPYVAWLTYFNNHGLALFWPVLKATAVHDTSITHWIYQQRALMTLLFGVSTSWPTRTTNH